MKKLIYICLILLLTSSTAWAYYPSIKLDLENIKMKRAEKEKLKLDLLEYLKDSPEALKTKGKRFKEDQCKPDVAIPSVARKPAPPAPTTITS